jgi:hypothetical protein
MHAFECGLVERGYRQVFAGNAVAVLEWHCGDLGDPEAQAGEP